MMSVNPYLRVCFDEAIQRLAREGVAWAVFSIIADRAAMDMLAYSRSRA